MDLTMETMNSPNKKLRSDTMPLHGLGQDEPDSQGSRDSGPQQSDALDLTSAHHTEPAALEGGDNHAVVSLNEAADVSLADIQIRRTLFENAQNKTIAIEGEYKGEPAVVILEKTPFTEDSLKALREDAEKSGRSLERDFVNDIYGHYSLLPSPALNGIKLTLIHPATRKHIDKYITQEFHLLEETYEDYINKTLPYITSSQFDLTWVYNILEHKKESERILVEDTNPETGFVLLPDLKWDAKQTNNLYLIAISAKRDLKSLRDLTSEHLPLLRNIKAKCTTAICEKFDIEPTRLRAYFHYQPSYYHLHVHFTAMSFDAPGSRVERAHLLDDVINNLVLVPDFYQRATLHFPTPKGHPLFEAFSPRSLPGDESTVDN